MSLIYWIIIFLLCYLVLDNSLVAYKDFKQDKKIWKLAVRFGMLIAILLIIINITARVFNIGLEIPEIL
ncbi:MAG: hypothetical protein ABII27_07500 [bacterium]